MIEIKLTQGKVALVDEEDFARVNTFKWSGHFKGRKFYTHRALRVNGKRTSTSMHRFIMSCSPGDGLEVDHINHNPLDNRKSNLRITTRFYNSKNRMKYKSTTSKYKGVQFRKERNKWIAVIRNDGKLMRVGSFNTQEEAALAYNKAALMYFGTFAHLNVIETPPSLKEGHPDD